jgi:hypothetical protein
MGGDGGNSGGITYGSAAPRKSSWEESLLVKQLSQKLLKLARAGEGALRRRQALR